MNENSSGFKILLLWTTGQLLFVLLLFNFSNWYIFRDLESKANLQLDEDLVQYSRLITDIIGNRVESNLELALYEHNIDQTLDRLSYTLQLTNITILDTTGTTLFSSDKTINLFEKYPYILVDKSAYISALSGIPATSKTYEKKDQMYKTAFIPIENTRSEIVGILVTEADSQFLGSVQVLRSYSIILSILSLISIFLIGILFVFVIKRFQKSETALINAVTFSTMGQMASILAHEIKNPLAIIRVSADRLKNKLSEQDAEVVEYIKEEVTRLNLLTESYLSLTRPGELPKRILHLSEIIEQTVNQMQIDFERSGIKIATEIIDDPEIKISPSGLRQILLNIFLNSKEAMPGGGTINIRLKKEGDKKLILKITDTGLGIPKDELKKITAPFYSTKQHGSGLGLYIVNQILGRHNAKLKISSIEDVGTIISITLPLSSKPNENNLVL